MQSLSPKKKKKVALILAIIVALAMIVSSISVIAFAAETDEEDKTKKEETAEEDGGTDIDEELAAGIATDLMNTYNLDKDAATSIGQAMTTSNPDAKAFNITNVAETDIQVIVDYKADGVESSFVYDKEQADTPADAQPVINEPNELGFFVGGEVIKTMQGDITLQTASLPIGYDLAGEQAMINDHAEQYKAWSRKDGDYMDTIALVAGNSLDALSQEPLKYALRSFYVNAASGDEGAISGADEALNAFFPSETGSSSFQLSDAEGNYYPMEHYITYMDFAPLGDNIGRFPAYEAFLAEYNGGYVGYVIEHGQKSSDAEDEAKDPVTMMSSLLQSEEYATQSKDEIVKSVKGKLEDFDISSLTKQSTTLAEFDATAMAADYVKCLLLGEAKYQMADVGNVMDSDLYFHTVGEGGAIATPASYAEETPEPAFTEEYTIEDTEPEGDFEKDKLKEFMALAAGNMAIFAIVVLILIISLWRIFSKAGEPGWKSIIPFYGMYTFSKIATGSALWFWLMFIPFLNIAAYIMVTVKLAKSFGKGIGYGVGMLVLPVIFYPLLAFSGAEYAGYEADTFLGTEDRFEAQYAESARESKKAKPLMDEDDELDDIDDYDDL